MLAKHVMTRHVSSVAADASVYDAAQVLLNGAISAAPVVDADGKMIGIVSEADLMHRPEIGTVPGKTWLQRLLTDDSVLAKNYIHSHSHRVADVMTKVVVSAGEHTTLLEIAALMERHKVKRIPILHNGKIVGIVSRANLLQGLLAREPSSPDDLPADETIRAGVAAALAKQGWAESLTTHVVTRNGVVHLWGNVSSEAVRKAYQIAAETVRGVSSVKNHIIVLPPDLRFAV